MGSSSVPESFSPIEKNLCADFPLSGAARATGCTSPLSRRRSNSAWPEVADTEE